jgi:hypothetical protein
VPFAGAIVGVVIGLSSSSSSSSPFSFAMIAYLLYQVGDFVFGVVEDGLDERLQGRVTRLEIIYVLFVYALAPMVRIGVVYAWGIVYGGTCRTGWSGAVALCLDLAYILPQAKAS